MHGKIPAISDVWRTYLRTSVSRQKGIHVMFWRSRMSAITTWRRPVRFGYQWQTHITGRSFGTTHRVSNDILSLNSPGETLVKLMHCSEGRSGTSVQEVRIVNGVLLSHSCCAVFSPAAAYTSHSKLVTHPSLSNTPNVPSQRSSLCTISRNWCQTHMSWVLLDEHGCPCCSAHFRRTFAHRLV